jgi:hypothetical protein
MSNADFTEQLALDSLRSDVEVVPGAVRTRLSGRIVASAALLAGPARGQGAGNAGPGSVTGASALPVWVRGSGVALLLPIGALLGAAAHAWLTQPPPAMAPAMAAPAALALAPSQPIVSAAPPPPVPVDALPAAVPSLSRVKSTAAQPASLEAELRLLEQARTKLAEGDPVGTLALLGSHRSSYPQSRLREERDALEIKALVASGRRAEASRRADSFLRNFPGSVLRDAVARSTGKIP